MTINFLDTVKTQTSLSEFIAEGFKFWVLEDDYGKTLKIHYPDSVCPDNEQAIGLEQKIYACVEELGIEISGIQVESSYPIASIALSQTVQLFASFEETL